MKTPAMIRISTPDETLSELQVSDSTYDSVLSSFLAKHGQPLKTLCGERGLCKGCQVILRHEGSEATVKACQTPLKTVIETGKTVVIPEQSRLTTAFHAVTAFEIELPEAHLRSYDAEGYGLVFDIGTTTVAAALWDMKACQCLQTASCANAQFRYGDNVLSRITYSLENKEHIKILQSAVIEQSLIPLIEQLYKKANIQQEQIHQCIVAANTIMLHALCGVTLEGFSRYPFTPVFLEERSFPAETLGLSPECHVRLLPSLGAFVGADVLAGALACNLQTVKAPALFVDFGTNGEILLKHPHGYYATATAAGPAFEGGRLSCGSIVRDGVITGLNYCKKNHHWNCEIAGKLSEKKATGISGSAYIDFMAQAVENGIINSFGRFIEGTDNIQTVKNDDGTVEKRIYLTPSLYISEVDIAELLQAKAAIAGGIAALLEHANISVEELESVFIAGGFGYHINPTHALRIGLFPSVAPNRIHIVGNTSLGGASLCLFSKNTDTLLAIKVHCETLELNNLESFEDHFTDALMLNP